MEREHPHTPSSDLSILDRDSVEGVARYLLTERDVKRFRSKVIERDGCWGWTGSFFQTGYAIFNVKMADGVWRPTTAHRVSYEIAVGPIADGLHIDHLCRNRQCVNPAHLEPVTPRINNLRGESRSAQQARWTHCPKGHPFNDENTYTRKTGKRECRACARERDLRRVRSSGHCVVCGAYFETHNRNVRACSQNCGRKLAGRTGS